MSLETPPPRRRLILRLGALVAALAVLTVVGLKARGVFAPNGAEASPASAKGGDKDGKAKEKEPASVAVATVEVGSISAYTAATANLVAEDDVKVVAEAEG